MSGPESTGPEAFKEGPIVAVSFLVGLLIPIVWALVVAPFGQCGGQGWTFELEGKLTTSCSGGMVVSEVTWVALGAWGLLGALVGLVLKRLIRGDEYVRMQRELNSRAAAEREATRVSTPNRGRKKRPPQP